MAKLPTVAIIGRPNTGKSTLFNRMVGRRKAIVSEIPGTTRDRIAHRIETDEMDYLLVDTGGMGGGTEDIDLEDDVQMQSELALENADVILFTVNSREELTGSDHAIVDLLRKKRKAHVPVIIVLTKCDNIAGVDTILPQYYELGIADTIIPVSATHDIGTDELQQEIIKRLVAQHFTKPEASNEPTSKPNIAIIGKPNVGKSSLINAFMSEPQRKEAPLIVSDIPGTTRDAVDTLIRYHEREYVFIDTAGIKRQRSTDKGIETFSYFRSVQALQQCDIAVLALDATEAVSKQDKRIAGMAVEEGKGLIILVNKIDMLNAEKKKEKMKEVELTFPFCRFAPILACSAVSREGLLKIFDMIDMVHGSRTRRIPTKDLHRWFTDAVYGQPMGTLAKSKHITQADELPPTFVVFVRDPKSVQVSQLRYLENRLRETFSFEGTPVRWITKSSSNEQ